MRSETHYEVRWKGHDAPDRVSTKTSVKFSTLELAQREAERIRDKNRLFMEVDGFRPFISDVTIWRVRTHIVRTEMEEMEELVNERKNVSANRLALLWHCHIAEKVSLTYIQCHDNELCHQVGVGWVEPEEPEVSG